MKSAKSAQNVPRVKADVPYIDFKHQINHYILFTWQDDLNGTVANKLHCVKSVFGDWQSSYRRCRKDGIVVSCRHRSRTFDLFIRMKERLSTSV